MSSLDLLHLAKTAAARGAGYLRAVERPADPAGWTAKSRRDFVTEVDRNAERMIADLLLAAEPGSRIIGEKLSPDVVAGGLVWVVDPLDGTTNFLHDFPSYAVSVAAAVDERERIGPMTSDPRPTPKTPLADWIDAVAALPPSPAGGSVAAIAASLAAALAEMVAVLTHSKERHAAGHERARSVLGRAPQLRDELLHLAVRDAEAFARFLGARGEARTKALEDAARIQLDLLKGAAAATDLAVTMADAGAPSALGDAATGAFLAAAAARSAYWAMRSDLDATSAQSAPMLSLGLELLEQAEAAEWRVRQILNERIR